MIRYKDIVNRITGLSCPVFGLSSNPQQAAIRTARQLINHLEDKRVLYKPQDLETPEYCILSVIEIRKLLNDAINVAGIPTDLIDHLKAMRAACRKFLDNMEDSQRRHGSRISNPYGFSAFSDDLGFLRGTFGIHIAQIAVRYGIDIEDDLASILPASVDDSVEKDSRRRRGAK